MLDEPRNGKVCQRLDIMKRYDGYRLEKFDPIALDEHLG